MNKIKNKYGSVLVFALIILFIGIAAAIGIASSTMISQKNSINTASSTQSFQVADSGAEIVLNKIKNASDGDTLGSLGLSCSSGVISGNIGTGKEYKVTAYDIDGSKLACTAILTDVDKLKSVGSYKNTNRAVEVAVIRKKIAPNSDIAILMDYSSSMGLKSDGDSDLNKEIEAVKYLIEQLDQPGAEYQIGIIFFSTGIEWYPLTSIADKDSIIQYIDDHPTEAPDLTNTGYAMESAIYGLENSSRYGTNPQVILIITDGAPNITGGVSDESVLCSSGYDKHWDITAANNVLEASDEARSKEMQVFAIGVGLDNLASQECTDKATELLSKISLSGSFASIDEIDDLKETLDALH